MANLKKNLAYNFLLSCSQVLLPLVSIPYITRVLLPDGIGRVSFIDSLSYYFVAIAEFGIVVYGIREVARVRGDKKQLRKLVSELLVLHFITSTISLLLYVVTVSWLWQKVQDIRLVFFSFSFLLANFFACEWYFWGMERFRYITIRSLISRLLALASIFVLIKEPPDYYIYYGIMVGASAINYVINALVLFSQLPLQVKQLNLRRHLRYVWVTWLISLFYGITLILDHVLLRVMSTTAAVGIYAFSIKIVRLSTNVLTDVFLVLYPRTVALIKEQKTDEIQEMINRSVQLIILLSVPLCMAVYLLSEPLVNIFFGAHFRSVDTNLKILALFPLIKTYSLFLSKQILISYNRERLYLNTLITGSLLFVVFTLYLSSRWNDRGASMAIMLAELVILVLNYYYVKRTLPQLNIFDLPTLLKAFAGSLLFFPVIHFTRVYIASDMAVLLVSALICIPVYFLLQVFLFRNNLVHDLYRQYVVKKI